MRWMSVTVQAQAENELVWFYKFEERPVEQRWRQLLVSKPENTPVVEI